MAIALPMRGLSAVVRKRPLTKPTS